MPASHPPSPAPRFGLLQARNPGDRARDDEHAAFAAQLEVAGEQIVPIDVLAGDLGPHVLDGIDVLLVGGSGEYSVLDDHPAIKGFVDFLAQVTDAGMPTFASCFGFQALVLGLGGQVVSDHAAAEVGSYDLELTPAGAADRLFSGLPQRFVAQLGHKDRAEVLPDSVVHLASSALCPYQALTLPGRPVYATQFHPELTWLDNKARFRAYFEHYGRLFGLEEAQRRLDAHRPSPDANALMRRFVDLVLGG